MSLDEAKKIWSTNNSIQLYLASRSLTEDRRRELVDLCVDIGVKVKKISTYSDMLRESEINLTDLSISDLISRKDLNDDDFNMDYLKGKNIMVTGAGGSIGSELARIISKVGVKSLVLIDISEASLFSISEEIKEISEEEYDTSARSEIEKAGRIIPALAKLNDTRQAQLNQNTNA